jgi:hypothetical protein
MSATDLAFRAQLVIPEQRQLFDYWSSKCGERTIPSRRDIRPQEISRLLPFVSLTDVVDGGKRMRVRLAGTQLREFFGREITGAYLDDLELGAKPAYWTAANERLCRGLPAQGILPVHRPGGEFVTRFWIRLPLAEDSREVNMILGYDAFVFASKLGALASRAGAAGATG